MALCKIKNKVSTGIKNFLMYLFPHLKSETNCLSTYIFHNTYVIWGDVNGSLQNKKQSEDRY